MAVRQQRCALAIKFAPTIEDRSLCRRLRFSLLPRLLKDKMTRQKIAIYGTG
jgi:hypothetical protein